MTPLLEEVALHTPIVQIGGIGIALRTGSARFARMVEDRYDGFVTQEGAAELSFDVELFDPHERERENARRRGTTLAGWDNRFSDPLNDPLSAPIDDAFAEPPDDLAVTCEHRIWRLHRGDFDAHWNPRTGRGHIRQTVNPYALDSVLRIVHSLVLAQQGAFLIHAASAIRNGRAFLFSGISGAGNTTI
jgi:hypothetical protein